MNAEQPLKKRSSLSEDGELLQAVEVPDTQAAIYCTQCGTANRANSRFCRQCGSSLDEQMLDGEAGLEGLPRRKSKYMMESTSDTRERAQAAGVIITAVAVAAIVITLATAAPEESYLIPFVLIAWVIMTLARRRRL
jgi:hypothetical protein